jgi:hypothetical protein
LALAVTEVLGAKHTSRGTVFYLVYACGCAIWMAQCTVPAAEGHITSGIVRTAGGQSISPNPPPAGKASGEPDTPRRANAALRRIAWWLAGILTLIVAATTAAFAHAATSRPAAQLPIAAATIDYQGCAVVAAHMPIVRLPHCVPKPLTPGV